MYRTILKDLQGWKDSEVRRPLLLKGSVMVGKTWTLQEFGRFYYEDVLYVDCKKTSYMQYLADGTLEADRILSMLSTYHGEEIIAGATLMIFDEIQAVPGLLNTILKLAGEYPELHICMTGNMVSRELPSIDEELVTPDILELLPMSFKEFLLASHNDDLVEKIENGDGISDGAERFRMMTQLEMYFLVGGLPAAVKAWINTGELGRVRDIHMDAFEAIGDMLYEVTSLDLSAQAMKFLRTIPEALKKENKKYSFSLLNEKNAARDYADAIGVLKDNGVIDELFRAAEGIWPPEQHVDEKCFKFYFNDIGLLTYLYGLENKSFSEREIFGLNNGALTEQFVYQELRYNKNINSLAYWTNRTPPAKADFLFADEKVMIPIEVVKPGKRAGNSLSTYSRLYGVPVGIRLSLDEVSKKPGILTIPLYAIWNL